MKKFATLLIICLATGSFVNAQQTSQESSKGPAFTWEETTYDFGDIHQGDKVEHVYSFTNTGNEPLIITNVQVTCGCTAPKWPRDPIQPGQKSEITVAFNSTGKMGQQNKVVTIVSNAIGDNNKISFKTNVLQKEQQPQ